jgi:nitroimidazol reductase NimA-like FMN-containing flavoprotein (pyridoxamine 5'-phosphate oxidase superfamily)
MIEMHPHEIDAMLHETSIGRLSMADNDGRPYTIPMPFCWLDGSLYLRLPMTGRKGRILSRNNRVCFEIDSFTDTLDEYASVLIEGRLVTVSSVEEKLRVRKTTQEKYTRLRRGHRPGHGRSTPIDQLAMQKIVVEQLSGRRKEPAPLPAGQGA